MQKYARSAAVWATVVAALGLLVTALVAPQAQAVDPALLPETAQTPVGGVVDPDLSAVTASLAEEAAIWDMEVIGNTVYIAGTFTRVSEKYNGTKHNQAYLAAFDGTSGDWIEWWAPQLNGPAYALDTTSSGQLVVGGEFTAVNGDTLRAGVVAINAATGAIDPTFRATVERRWSTSPLVVRDISTTGDRMYLAGNFNHVNGERVYKAARVDRSTGVVDAAFKPQVTGRSAHGIVESSDGQRVHLGGWFTAVGAQPGTETLATVSATDGAVIPWNHGLPITPHPWAWAPTGGIVLDIDVYENNLYVAGAEHFWFRLDSQTGQELQFYPARHDTQSVNVIGDRVFIGCHCRLTPEFWTYQIDAPTGEFVGTYTNDWTGDDGTWAVAITPDQCVWTGGGLDSGLDANGNRVWLGNLARNCPAGGPIPHNVPSLVDPGGNPGGPGFTCTVVANGNGSATIMWQDIGANGYDVGHDGGSATWVTDTTFADFTPGTDYTVLAWGNGTNGTSATCTNPNPGGGGPGFTCSVAANANGSATISWPDIGANGYDLSHDGEAPIWVNGTSFSDFTPGTSYTIVAWGNGVGGTSTTCTNPNPGGGGPGFTCTVTANGNGSVTVSWPDIGANGYDFSHDGEAAIWVTQTSWTDFTPGTDYTIIAWGNGVGGTTTTCRP